MFGQWVLHYLNSIMDRLDGTLQPTSFTGNCNDNNENSSVYCDASSPLSHLDSGESDETAIDDHVSSDSALVADHPKVTKAIDIPGQDPKHPRAASMESMSTLISSVVSSRSDTSSIAVSIAAPSAAIPPEITPTAPAPAWEKHMMRVPTLEELGYKVEDHYKHFVFLRIIQHQRLFTVPYEDDEVLEFHPRDVAEDARIATAKAAENARGAATKAAETAREAAANAEEQSSDDATSGSGSSTHSIAASPANENGPDIATTMTPPPTRPTNTQPNRKQLIDHPLPTLSPSEIQIPNLRRAPTVLAAFTSTLDRIAASHAAERAALLRPHSGVIPEDTYEAGYKRAPHVLSRFEAAIAARKARREAGMAERVAAEAAVVARREEERERELVEWAGRCGAGEGSRDSDDEEEEEVEVEERDSDDEEEEEEEQDEFDDEITLCRACHRPAASFRRPWCTRCTL